MSPGLISEAGRIKYMFSNRPGEDRLQQAIAEFGRIRQRHALAASAVPYASEPTVAHLGRQAWESA